MKNNHEQSDTNESKPFRRLYLDTYDKVPQPEGEFKNLFHAMQEKSNTNNQQTAKNNKSNQRDCTIPTRSSG